MHLSRRLEYELGMAVELTSAGKPRQRSLIAYEGAPRGASPRGSSMRGILRLGLASVLGGWLAFGAATVWGQANNGGNTGNGGGTNNSNNNTNNGNNISIGGSLPAGVIISPDGVLRVKPF